MRRQPFLRDIYVRQESLLSKGYHAGFTKDVYGCNTKPCECAGIQSKDRTILGVDSNSSLNKIWTNDISIHCLGDIILTPKTATRLIPFSSRYDKSLSVLMKNDETLWTGNNENGFYIVGYIIDENLDTLNKQIIPKVKEDFCIHSGKYFTRNFDFMIK